MMADQIVRDAASGFAIPATPLPPDFGSMDPRFNLIFLILNCIVLLGFVIYAWKDFRRTGSTLAFPILIGGGLCVFLEPVVDILGLCWFWEDGNWTVGQWMGRFIPIWLVPVYAWFVGGQTLLTLKRFERGVQVSDVFKLYLIYAMANVVLEEVPLHFGLYTYYGAQPLQISLLPLWWPMINAAMPIVAAALVMRASPLFGTWTFPATIALMPMADALTNAAIGWPIHVALNTSDSLWVTHLAAAVSGIFVFVTLNVVAHAAGHRALPITRPVTA
jgi:hypothetical protein